MLTGKDLTEKLEIEKYINNYITSQFSNINLSDYLYLDEIYTSIFTKLNLLSEIDKIPFSPMNEYNFVDEKPFDDFTEKYKLISGIVYKIIPELFTNLQTLSDNIITTSENISKLTHASDTILTKIEEEIKTNIIKQSIKEESIIYDSIGPGTSFKIPELLKSNLSTIIKTGDSLTIDENAQNITLPIVKSVPIPFSIDITCNKNKGSYMPAGFNYMGSKTFDTITNGYFHSRMFAENPRLEIEDIDYNISNLVDNNPETGIIHEYNSIASDDVFNITYNLKFEEAKIDSINIIFEPYSAESTSTTNIIYPTLTRLHIENSNTDTPISEDIEKIILDKTINIDGRVSGLSSKGINYNSKAMFPTAAYSINKNKISNIALDYSITTPHEIYYLEKTIYDSGGNETYRFNYFETLVLNNYITPKNRQGNIDDDIYSDPYTYYTSSDLQEMNEIISGAYKIIDEKIKLYRYMIGIKDIQLYKTIYAPSGSITTDNLIPNNKTVAAVELYINEIVDTETSIKYYISTSGTAWINIVPSNTAANINDNKRVTFLGFDAKTGDVIIPEQCNKLYLKIEMKGTESKTPILKSYSLKVKYI